MNPMAACRLIEKPLLQSRVLEEGCCLNIEQCARMSQVTANAPYNARIERSTCDGAVAISLLCSMMLPSFPSLQL